MMGLGKWDIEIRREFALDNEVNKKVSFLQYQHSNIPLFHVRGINIKPHKIHLISISCRISETLKTGPKHVMVIFVPLTLGTLGTLNFRHLTRFVV